jgi:hypothetical protein
MITIRRNYWLVWEDDGTDDGAGTPQDYEYNSLEEADRFCGIYNEIYAPRRFFSVQHQKDIEIEEITCGDCGAKEGLPHRPGCDMERCSFCGKQLISCDCAYDILGIKDKEKYGPETCYLPPKIYSKGLTKEQTKQWDKLLRQKGLIPFISYPNMCAKCGKLWPNMFMVPNEEWKHYIEPEMRDKMLCMDCYATIKYLIDSGAKKRNA